MAPQAAPASYTPMIWLCDEMLARLARLLRAAGHDTALAASGAPDRELLEQARIERRILLTRDRGLASAAASHGLLIGGDSVQAQAASLGAQAAIDWTLAPFTRCLVDNSLLRPATEAEITSMPPSVTALPGPFTACAACGRLFWAGSHVKRLTARLADLQRERGNHQPGSEVSAGRGTEEFQLSKHSPSGHTPTTLPADDLASDPGIGSTRGTTMAGEDPDLIEGENTVEGDVANDTTASGGIDPNQRGRTNK